MFNLDKLVFDFIYQKCLEIGHIFSLGAFEGFILYLSIFSLAILKGFSKK